MFDAVSSGNPQEVIYALKNGCSVNKKNVYGETPLLCATFKNSEIVKILLDAGAKVQVKNDSGNYPLHLAVAAGNYESVKILLSHPEIEINATNDSSKTPLYCAIEREFLQIVKLLVERGAKVGLRDFTIANSLNRVEIWHFLYNRVAPSKNKASFKSKEDYLRYFSLVQKAVTNGEVESLKTLIQQVGDNFVALTKVTNALYTIAHRGEDEYCRIAQILLENGSLIHEEGIDGTAPLFKAVQSGNLNMTKVFLEHGANVQATDSVGNTVLHHAVKITNMSLTRYLIDRGANVNARNNSEETPLHLAVKCGDYLSCLVLLKRGAAVNLTDLQDNHPLFLCLRQRNEWMIELLLSYGANVNVKNAEGRTFLREVIRLRRPQEKYDLVKYVAKLVYRDIEVWDLDVIKLNESLNDNYESCLAELAAMRESRFYNDVTLLDLLVANKLKRACYARNDELVAAFKVYKEETIDPTKKFKRYFDLLHDNFLLEVKRQTWLRPVAKFYSDALSFNNPFHIANQTIMLYLGDDELRRIGALCCENFADIIYRSNF